MAERPVLTDAQWAWAAGLLEGEGSFSLMEGRRPRVEINMTDFDVVRGLYELLGVGRLCIVSREKHGSKDAMHLDIRVAADAVWVMEGILPWMGERRSLRIIEVLEVWRANPTLPRVGRTHCKNGHEYTPENTYWVPDRHRPNPSRRCRTCAHDAQVRRRERLKGGVV